jgi:predicted RNA-binding protein associated with RNAse of E/G family
MQRKRLDRDIWNFKDSPYYQMRVDTEDFHGLVGLVQLTTGNIEKEGGATQFWDRPKAGRVAVCGPGMNWLQLIPDGKSHMLTAKYLPDDTVSIWYADIIEGIDFAPDEVAIFIDKYLDVTFTPQGDVSIDDRDELDEAYQSGELSEAQYASAIEEGDFIVAEYCADIAKTTALCGAILAHVRDRIGRGDYQVKTVAHT